MPSFGPIGGGPAQKYGAWGPVPANPRGGPYGPSYDQQAFGQQPYGQQAYSPYGQQGKGGADIITTVWVGDLPFETSDQDLLDNFAFMGNVMGASVSRKPAASGVKSGFVRFASRAEGDGALQAAASGSIIVLGTPVTCQWARSNTTGGLSGGSSAPVQQYSQVGAVYKGAPKGVPKGASKGAPNKSWSYSPAPAISEELSTIWVGNLPEGTSDMDLAGVFGQFGYVVGASVRPRPSPMGSYGGFVRFANGHEANHALSVCSSGQVYVQSSALVAQWAKTNSKVDPSILPAPAPAPQYNSYPEYSNAGPPTSGLIPQPDGASGSVQTLFIGSLPTYVTEADVTMALSSVGIEGTVTLNKPSSRGGSGFVRFTDPHTAQISLGHLIENPIEMDGQQIIFKWAKNDTFRTA